ncbi:hypothetical protein [Stenotrophomonas sp. Iso1]|uniref:hypothetical protein n=1 Tax=Stenotrophomonas sp. Iso1 TaxID=2977283 RepID=UPI0022B7B5B4|nr:hypothetical protein [Stenotrophomonas sp. Iso1]
MTTLLNHKALEYFFGHHFNAEMAMDTASHLPDIEILALELSESIRLGTPHFGLQLICHLDVDSGAMMIIVTRDATSLSGISFFIESQHRVFGGQTLLCVPLAFCSSFYEPSGDHTVYRHTYKRPLFDTAEIQEVMTNGSDMEKLKAFMFTKSRDGYETIKGMSYVGITRRSWQKRYMEHVQSAQEKLSSTRFHNAIRAMQGQEVICVHDVSSYGLSKEAAKAYESSLIKSSTLWPRGLNMKP